MNYKPLHIITLWVCILLASCQVQHLSKMESNYTEIHVDKFEEDTAVEALLAPYRQSLQQEMSMVIGHTAEPLSKGKPESKLGNLIADIIKWSAEKNTDLPIDFAIQNLGGIRIPTLHEGTITRGTAYELMPFDNEVLILTMSSEGTQQLLDNIAASGGIPVSEGLSMKIQDKKAVDIMIGGKPFESNRTYNIACPDFVANGGDNFDELKNAPRTLTGILIRDAIIEHFISLEKQGKPITATMQKRIVEK